MKRLAYQINVPYEELTYINRRSKLWSENDHPRGYQSTYSHDEVGHTSLSLRVWLGLAKPANSIPYLRGLSFVYFRKFFIPCVASPPCRIVGVAGMLPCVRHLAKEPLAGCAGRLFHCRRTASVVAERQVTHSPALNSSQRYRIA